MDDFESIKGQLPFTLTADAVTAQQTAQLPEGVYSIINNTLYDARIKIDTTANDVTAATGRLLMPGNEVKQELSKNDRIGLIGVGGSVTLDIIRIRARAW